MGDLHVEAMEGTARSARNTSLPKGFHEMVLSKWLLNILLKLKLNILVQKVTTEYLYSNLKLLHSLKVNLQNGEIAMNTWKLPWPSCTIISEDSGKEIKNNATKLLYEYQTIQCSWSWAWNQGPSFVRPPFIVRLECDALL